MWKYYFLFTVLPRVHTYCVLAFVVFLICSAALAMLMYATWEEMVKDKECDQMKFFRRLQKVICFSFMFLIPCVFIPTQKQALLYVSGNMLMKANQATHASDKAVKFINLYLDKEIQGLEGDKKKGEK